MLEKKDEKTSSSKESKVKKQNSSSLTDQATEELRNRILDLTLLPSQRLDEKMLLKKFPFGRTPIREALNRLISEGLVKSKNTRGTYVASMSIDHTLQLLDAYVISEKVVSFVVNLKDPSLLEDLISFQDEYKTVSDSANLLLVTEINSKFHNRIAEATSNQFIIANSADLHNLARRLSYFVYKTESQSEEKLRKHLQRINKDHKMIINHIKKGDRKGLIQSCTDHALLFKRRLGKVLQKDGVRELVFSDLS